MTIHPHLQNKKQWVLGRNRREVDDTAGFGCRGARRFDFDGYWSGENWVRGAHGAMQFQTECDAFGYLEEHLASMENLRPPRMRS